MSYRNPSLNRGISTAVSLSRGSPDSAYSPGPHEAGDTPSALCHEHVQSPCVSRRGPGETEATGKSGFDKNLKVWHV